MIPDLLHTLASDPERFERRLWNHRLSGNVLELYVKPDYASSPEEYRTGVIQIGQVLQAIDSQITLNGQTNRVRTFPNLEESQLIALVRLNRSYAKAGVKKASNIDKTEFHGRPVQMLKSIASHSGLFFHQFRGESEEEISRLLGNIRMNDSHKEREHYGRFYALCATADNPFVWLRTGEWLERVHQLAVNELICAPLLTYTIAKNERTALTTAFNNCSYVQVLAQLC